MRLLLATLGTTLCATWFIGWLNGVIAVMTPSSGSRVVMTLRRLPCGVRSHENTWPSSRSASLAPNPSTSATRPISYRLSCLERPDSRVMRSDASSVRSRSSAAARCRIAARS